MTIIIGTAGWSVPTNVAGQFPSGGTSLQRYAARFAGAEINSSFHRSHRRSTWERWKSTAPDHFRFSAKLPKTITHGRKLVDCTDLLGAYLGEAGALGEKLALHLVQLPPSLAFNPEVAEAFFAALSGASDACIACEPRHPSWFEPAADALLERLQVARVAADPARVPEAAIPGGWPELAYFRLHGSPVAYRSSYDDERLAGYAEQIRVAAARARQVWCIFDNTASSAALGNALTLTEMLGRQA